MAKRGARNKAKRRARIKRARQHQRQTPAIKRRRKSKRRMRVKKMSNK